jgi:hypothetical protein
VWRGAGDRANLGYRTEVTGDGVNAKPTVEELGIDVAAQRWQRSGEGDGTIEVAMVTGAGQAGVDWVLMRVAGDPGARVLVYDRHEWECFLDGVRKGEFDDGAALDALEPGRAEGGAAAAVPGQDPARN